VVQLSVVAGAIDEAAAAAIPASGADFVSEDPLDRLATAFRGCVRQVEERRRRETVEDASRDTQERFRTALEALPDGVAILSSIRDPSGRITDFRYEYANEALSARVGLSQGQLIGKQLLELFPAEIESGMFADCCELVEREELLAREDVAFREDYGVRRISVGLDLHAAKLDDGVILVSSPVIARTQAEEISAQLAAIVDSCDDAVISMTLDGEVESWNRGAEQIYGYSAGDAVGRQLSWLVPPGRDDEIPAILERVRRGQQVAHYETVHRRSNESVIDVAITVSPVVNASGRVIGASSIARDVTDDKRAEAALWEAQELFHRVFDAAPIGMAILDLDLGFVGVNDALCGITGYSREQLQATNCEAITHPDDLGKQKQEIAAVLAGEAASCRSEKRLVHAGRSPVWVAIQTTVLRDADARPLRFIAQIQDITDRRRSEEDRLVYLADHDPLTGVLNRRSFERELEAHGRRGARYGGGGAAIMLDLDNFKFINDTLGHHAGDEAIIRTARVLGSRLRETDVLARLGGDEFAVLLPKADASKARVVAEELLGALRAETVELGPHERPLAASAGIALFETTDEPTGEDVLVNADLAMYDAKNAGRDRAEIYASSGQGSSRMQGRITWAQRIGGALQHDGFTLVAQPIVELATGRTSRHELLLRMRDEHDHNVLPGSFLYIAERLGMVQEIDRWVTTQAITLLAEHRDRGEELTLEVNLSGLSIGNPELLALVSYELERTGVAPHNLIFEITETAAVINMPRASQFIRDLNQLGCRFALDDFGAGYGSFYYLKHLPFDFLKIDGEFVKNCRTSQTDRLLIKAAVDIAVGMGKRTIAEFVGDQETVRLLTNLGVDYGQGFHLGHPEPLAVGVCWQGPGE
jgi:diguanylate cyclase (GGDEF)-like protein/PAS domain S-box-containing protein